jgi:hypothetical protein
MGSKPAMGLYSGNARYWVMSRNLYPMPGHRPKRSLRIPVSNFPIGCPGPQAVLRFSSVQACSRPKNETARAVNRCLPRQSASEQVSQVEGSD